LGGSTPNYNDSLVQQLYMLRFFPAYLAEYYLMYRKMLRDGFLPQQLNVLSIGCGCGVDFRGLEFAVRDSRKYADAQIDYTGVDIVDWEYQFSGSDNKSRVYHEDISQSSVLDYDDYNVLVFPKSIGEFPDAVFDAICRMFENAEFANDHIVLLCSLMDQGGFYDSQRVERMASALQKHGFKCLDSADEYWHMPGSSGLNNYCSGFDYPDGVLATVKSLANFCPTHNEQGGPCKSDCKSRLDRWPILTARYIKYALLRFER
jgi:hypothetical protein